MLENAILRFWSQHQGNIDKDVLEPILKNANEEVLESTPVIIFKIDRISLNIIRDMENMLGLR